MDNVYYQDVMANNNFPETTVKELTALTECIKTEDYDHSSRDSQTKNSKY